MILIKVRTEMLGLGERESQVIYMSWSSESMAGRECLELRTLWLSNGQVGNRGNLA